MTKIIKNEISVESALATFGKALEKAHEINNVTNETLKTLLGAFIGGTAAFSHRPMKLNTFFTKALKALKADKELKAYSRKFEDYVTHEIGVTKTEDGFELTDSKKLSTAAEAAKTASIVTYVSEEKAAEKAEKDSQKKAAKEDYESKSAKDQIMFSLTQLLAAESDKFKKLSDKANKEHRNLDAAGLKAEKRTAYVKSLIAFLETQV